MERSVVYAKCLRELCEYYEASPFTPINVHSEVKDVIYDYVKDKQIGKKRALEILDSKGIVDYACILDASGFLDKSIYTFIASKHLLAGGYMSWAITTRYYSRFYSVNALLAIQGIRLLHIRGRAYLLERLSRTSPGKYSITKPKLRGGGHRYIWNLFAKCFSDYEVSEEEENIFFSLPEKTFEVQFREEITYWIYPSGFADLYAPYLVNNAKYEALKNFLDDKILQESMVTLETGIEENLAGKSVRQTLKMLAEIVACAIVKVELRQLIENWLNRLDVFDVNDETRKTLKSWIREALQKIDSVDRS